MVLVTFLTELLKLAVKPLMSALLSLLLTVSSAFTGPMGDYMALSAKTLIPENTETNFSYEASLDFKELIKLAADILGEEIPEEEFEAIDFAELLGADEEISEYIEITENGEFKLSDSYNIYTDIDNFRMVIESAKKPELKAYADTSAIGLSPELTKALLDVSDMPEYAAAYDKHMSGKSLYVDIAELIGDTELSQDELAAFTEGADMVKLLVEDAVEALTECITSQEFINTYISMYKQIYAGTESYYSEIEVDGVAAYKYSVTGMEALNIFSEVYNTMSTEEFVDSYVDLTKLVIASFGDTVMADLLEMPAELPEDEAAALYDELLTSSTEMNDEIQMLLSVFDTENTEELGELAMLIPLLENSRIETTLYEKDGKITTVHKTVISDGTSTLGEISINITTGKYDGEVISPAKAIAFENRMTEELLDNKVGFEAAKEKGVGSIEIYWDSEMTPETSLLTTSYEGFYINYKTSFADIIDSDDSLTDEEKEMMKELYGDEPEFATKDSSAHVIDGSVYLPLRQLMENAGYEVSWDAELRKAYVTVDDEKIEMTGTIIDNKTYVKVRDFEKLGATVDYEEEIHYADAWNDFSKTCYATITFAK